MSPSTPSDARGGGRAKWLIGGAVVVAAAVVGVVVLTGGGDDAGGGSAAVPAAVRSQPEPTKARIELDNGGGTIGLWQDQLIVVADGDVIAYDPLTGEERWSHAADDEVLLPAGLFVVHKGDLVRLDKNGQEATEPVSVEQTSYLYGASNRLGLSESFDNGDVSGSVLDPATLEVLVRDIDEVSPNGEYALDSELDYDAPSASFRILTTKDSKKLFEVDVDGAPTSWTILDDGRLALIDDHGELVVYGRDGAEVVSVRVGDAANIAMVAPNGCLVVANDGRYSAYRLQGDELTEIDGDIKADAIGGSSPDGLIFFGDGNDTVVARLDRELTELGSQRGYVVGVAKGVVYIRDDREVGAYDVNDLQKPLWTMDLDDDQSFTALDGMIAVTSTDYNDNSATIEIYR